MSRICIKERCKVNTNIDSDVFVGSKSIKGDIEISFPLGFRISVDESKLRRDILLLINVLSRNTDRKDSEINLTESTDEVQLPIQAYLYVINDYFSRGYYKERETVYNTKRQGRINWGRTIKTQQAYMQAGDVFYLDFITQKSNMNENELITLIHEYCVYESFNKMGWLFSSFVPQKPRIGFNKKMFIGVVQKKISETFNDRNKQLFKNMLSILSSLGDQGSANDFRYGTYRFEYIWEKMIDKAYGIKDKIDFFPRTQWVINDEKYDNSYLEPDTIMIKNGSIYVLDAKYYKYGWSKAPGHLPDSSSINKQITYGEYIAESNKFLYDGNHPKVYNAFLMPYDAYGKAFYTQKNLFYCGTAISDWKLYSSSKPYEHVVGILVDVKNLMADYTKTERKIVELANLIENQV